ncbi:mRNA cap guanine-N7 methyltransferase [Pandoravirus macleodensis]|uniref:mRNA (guanine-N(7))-methyltransferase n=1 Tax=Pandoravirus macleodensis TaxID=2107707 RepID=A0A2U7UEM6_9VIRU|nr:mRNA cap guanine-N7 methyltransferase [Pandoravirus macleodensis]AVK76887.1 mRNA cap guanine-N7 methyltransferase [Pandoravirus macleodensis]
MACEKRLDTVSTDGATKECAACQHATVKCWRCAPSARQQGRHALSGSDSSGGGRKAAAAARARWTLCGDDASSSSVGSSSAGSSSSDVVARSRNRHRSRRRRERSRGDTNTQSDSTPSSNNATEDGDSNKSRYVLERYVPDDEMRMRSLSAMSAAAVSVCHWYNRRAIEARRGTDAMPTLSHRPSSTSASSSAPSCADEPSPCVPPESSAPSRSPMSTSGSSLLLPDGDPSRDARGAINFCKSVLIGRYVQPHCTIMDLGCGRGQDVAKLAHARPRCVFFVDVADEPLVEAERRWRRTRFVFPAAFVQDDFCAPDGLLAHRHVVVHRDDPRRLHGQRHRTVPDDECALTSGDGSGIVDAITCQFAIQHAFATRESARAFVANVRRALRPGGVFLGIVADAACLWDLAARRASVDVDLATPAVACEDRPRRAVFALTDDADTCKVGGARSHVPCTLAVGNDAEPCPQYTVLFKDLNAMCVEAGLVLMASNDLAGFFDIESINPRNASMLDRMKAPLRLNDPDDREHLALYRVFAFARADRATARPMAAPTSEHGGEARRALQRERPPCRVISYVWSSDAADRSQQ